ncbi:hypothetical protein C8J25_101708 [Sphingomonas faeni]|uniref:Uncharacterized protein n=1 Tax=Sphingomonas faeni TaxID=185950 RepID=A0A2T5UCG1_9SPHN|nr:hypothetical protein [Sphingomonas faeni]PTW49202.1 hypothetical protein C8J25_101708 [Sphingomonas faeni]
MTNRDRDGERRRLKPKKQRKWAKPLVSPQMLKLIFAIGPGVAKGLQLLIELVKLFKG